MAKTKKIKRFRPRKEADAVEADFDETFAHVRQDVKRLREKFVREYIKDFNGSEAMRRMGYKHSAVHVHASKFLRHPYTQWFLRKLMDEMDEKSIVNRNIVLLGLVREANERGPDSTHSARVSAFKTIARCLGMEVHKVDGKIAIEGGGVLAVPLVGSVEDWEKLSTAAQAKLKEAVRK